MTDRQYELVYILPPDTTEQQVAELHQQLEAIVSRLTGPSSLNSTSNVGIGGTDLGHTVNHNGKTYFLFGDTFASEQPSGADWRNNVMAYSTDTTPAALLRDRAASHSAAPAMMNASAVRRDMRGQPGTRLVSGSMPRVHPAKTNAPTASETKATNCASRLDSALSLMAMICQTTPMPAVPQLARAQELA